MKGRFSSRFMIRGLSIFNLKFTYTLPRWRKKNNPLLAQGALMDEVVISSWDRLSESVLCMFR